MQENKLLSIAIPTYCRAESLRIALNKVLSQVVEFTDLIEVIISDNASTDHTQEVIEEAKLAFPSIDLLNYQQVHNTGIFGNFKKCRDLAKGHFLWILSDDDHITDNLIIRIINILKKENDIGILFLNGWVKKNFTFSGDYKVSDKLSCDDFICSVKERLTLVSAGIFRNGKIKNEQEFEGNTFFGLALTVSAKGISDYAIILDGPALVTKKDPSHSYNWFGAFVEGLNQVFKLMEQLNYKKKTIADFKNGILKSIIFKYYFFYKANFGQRAGLYNEKDEIFDIQKRLKTVYKDSTNYWIYLFPMSLLPPFLLANIIRIKHFLIR